MRPALALVSLLLGATLAAQDRLTPELLWRLRRVGAPVVSPTGEHLVYTVRSHDLEADAGTTQLHLLDLREPGEPIQLTTTGSNSAPCWHPDGRRLAFLSDRSGSSQIHLLDLAGGEARQLTEHPGGVANLQWSPDGRWFSFTATAAIDPDLREEHPDLPEASGRAWDDLMVRHWDQWEDGRYRHLFVLPAEGGEARDLMAGERVDTPLMPFGGVGQIAWAPDGRTIVYTAKKVENPERSTNSDLYAVDLETGTTRNLTTAHPGYDTDPRFSPDGRLLAWHSMARAGFESDVNRLMVLDRETGEVTPLHDDEPWSAHGTVWAPDAQGLFFTTEKEGTTQVFHTDLGGDVRPVTEGRWRFSGLSPVPGGQHLYAQRCRTERPYEIVRLDATRPDEGEAVTDENGGVYAGLRTPSVQERWFPATDGERIHSWVIRPPDFDPAVKWPLLLYCQGGPQSQVGQWFSYRWNFHLMAARGYIVLAVNRRGLPGFGREWNDSISRDWGGQAMQDLLSAYDAFVEEPYVDAERTAAVGASFGGYTVYWMMGNAGDRFQCMIAHCGVFDLRSMYLSTEELFFVDWDLGGPWWRSPEVARDYRRFSPSSYVERWETPLMVIHGQRDYRVPFTQGLQAFTAAQVQGVPSRLLYFPDEGHWILRPQNGVLWQREFFAWLDRWCGG